MKPPSLLPGATVPARPRGRPRSRPPSAGPPHPSCASLARRELVPAPLMLPNAGPPRFMLPAPLGSPTGSWHCAGTFG